MLEISPINPISFSTILGHEEYDYAQPFEFADTTKLQVLTDSDNLYCYLKECGTGTIVRTYFPDKIDTSISNQSFFCWEISIGFFGLEEGQYFLEVSNGDDEDLVSNPIYLAKKHEDTKLYIYSNSYNDFSVIFDTGITFTARIEGGIYNFTPKSDDEIYNDQKKNAVKLSAVPWQAFVLFVGNAGGIPDYIADKVNRIMACDTVKIDDQYYEKVDGAEWEVTRESEYPFSGLQLEIMPSVNNFLQRLSFDENEDNGNMVLKRLSLNYFNTAENITITGVAKKHTMLDYIAVSKAGADYTLKIGTTEGGSEIGEFEIEDNKTTLQVRYLFEGNQNIYISGITNASDISVVYDQVDEVVEAFGDVVPPTSDELPIGATIMYDQPLDVVLANFNVVTGLGYPDKPLAKWAISDGQGGRFQRRGRMPVGWEYGHSRYGTPGERGGRGDVVLVTGNLPPHTHSLKRLTRTDVKGGSNKHIAYPVNPWDYGEEGGWVETNIGNGLNSEPFDIIPYYTVSVFITKIA